jgi:hypothetical protein
VIPTLVANAFFMPRHLLPALPVREDEAIAPAGGSGGAPTA